MSGYNIKRMDIQIPLLDENKESTHFRIGKKLTQRSKVQRQQVVGSYRIGTFKLMKERKLVMDLMEKYMKLFTFSLKRRY